MNAWESANKDINTHMQFLTVNGENADRKRSASLIPYTEKEKRKAPRPDELQLIEREKVALSEVYSRTKKVKIVD